MKKICLNCSMEFETPKEKNIFCRSSCRAAYWLKRKGIFSSRQDQNQVKLPFKKIESGDLFNAIKKVKRTEDYWVFCHAMFWHTQDFHEAEQNKFKQQIADYFKDSKDIDATFIELIERACLAKRHVEE